MKQSGREFRAGALLAVGALVAAVVQSSGCANRSAMLVQTRPASSAANSPSARQVSFYHVPLACPAAPGIGCGSAAKPLLLDLEGSGVASEAWLNRAGSILGVVWSENSTHRQCSKIMKAALKKQDLTATELTANDRQEARKDFDSKTGWYRGAEVDRLSEAIKRKLMEQSTRTEIEAEMLNICRENLGEKETDILQEALKGEFNKRKTDR
jgi:hypothetical protein